MAMPLIDGIHVARGFGPSCGKIKIKIKTQNKFKKNSKTPKNVLATPFKVSKTNN